MLNSTQSALILFFGILVVYVNSATADTNYVDVIFQIFGFLLLAYNANCLVVGGCGGWSWLTATVPILLAVLYLYQFVYGEIKMPKLQPSPELIDQRIQDATDKMRIEVQKGRMSLLGEIKDLREMVKVKAQAAYQTALSAGKTVEQAATKAKMVAGQATRSAAQAMRAARSGQTGLVKIGQTVMAGAGAPGVHISGLRLGGDAQAITTTCEPGNVAPGNGVPADTMDTTTLGTIVSPSESVEPFRIVRKYR